jgi:hypothetical protein
MAASTMTLAIAPTTRLLVDTMDFPSLGGALPKHNTMGCSLWNWLIPGYFYGFPTPHGTVERKPPIVIYTPQRR